ncbi:triacylglycerol lipase [Petrotoga sp. 9PWA.NaAc.5.4]|uniref:esterase/lipase family protein n=1 Tax=Petrotoga sp. 9PWA.NaAc.5.4 TaxID=1434328 RepID=UPI0011B40310|nr:hypothetical protein [Petrotoga sp. 9PWA.NaAc.5.4]
MVEIYIPEGAYTSQKVFSVSPIAENSVEYQNLKSFRNFYGEIYQINFSDASKESSILPVTIRYKIPKQIYTGDNFVNFSLVYTIENEYPIISDFSGSKIVSINDQYYIEAETFQLTKIKNIGLVVYPPNEAVYGLRIMKDAPPSIEPDIILVPGSDLNFLGRLPNLSRDVYPQSFWSSLFPNRTIWNYLYPLTSTKSKNYTDSYNSFVSRTGINSYIEFEARRFAQELKRFPNKSFDIIAHGIGGLIVRYAIESDLDIKNVKNVVFISTPHKGTNLANPLLLNILYGKDPTILTDYLNVELNIIPKITANVSFYLEQINSYYKEIIPGSTFLTKLNSLEKRKDINYLTIAGTNSNIDANISKSIISKIYPEFINGQGDGIVHVDSAILDSADEKYYFFKGFYDLYTDQAVLNKIDEFLKKSINYISIEPFQDDNFLEYINETTYRQNNQESGISEVKELKMGNIIKPTEYYAEKEILTSPIKIGEIRENRLKIISVNGSVFFESPEGIYDNRLNKIFNKPVLGGIIFQERYYLCSTDGVYTINSKGEIDKIRDNVYVGDEVYYIPNLGFLSIKYIQGYSQIYLNDVLIQEDSTFISLKILEDGQIYLLFNDKIMELKENKLQKLIDSDVIKKVSGENIMDFVDFTKYGEIFFILTHDYKMIAWDRSKNEIQVISDENFGRLKLQLFEDNLYIFGKNHITYLQLKDMIMPRVYQRIEKDVFDILVTQNKEIWIVSQYINQEAFEVFRYSFYE